MNKKLSEWYESLTPEVKVELRCKTASVINWAYTVESESGGCKPNPDDTVRIYVESDHVTLTDNEVAYLAARVKDEFR
jgi:hypothetical protein